MNISIVPKILSAKIVSAKIISAKIISAKIISIVSTVAAVAASCRKGLSSRLLPVVLSSGVLALSMPATEMSATSASASDDQKIVAALDTQYQAAVKGNDADTMERLLGDDFVLVAGTGKTYTKADLLKEARSGKVHYEQQDDTEQAVRVWGDTAVITAKLWAKGADDGKPFEYRLWFSDTYTRTPTGWRYVFGQASSPLPKSAR